MPAAGCMFMYVRQVHKFIIPANSVLVPRYFMLRKLSSYTEPLAPICFEGGVKMKYGNISLFVRHVAVDVFQY